MPVMAFHFDAFADLAIAMIWVVAATLYWLSASRHSPSVNAALRPVRLYGMWLSIAWCVWYTYLFVDHVDEPALRLRGVTSGLVFVTAAYLILITAISAKTLRKMGVR